MGTDSYEDPSLAKLFPTASEIPEAVRIDPKANPPRMLIDGKVRTIDPSDPDHMLPVYSRVGVHEGNEIRPVLLGHEPKLGPIEVEEAMAAAERVVLANSWASASLDTRIAAVEKLAARLGTDVERIATLLQWEIGKPAAAARQEVTRSIDYIKDTIIELRALEGDRALYSGVAGKTTHHAKNVLRPLGTVLCVAPFNYPVNEFLTTIIPALLVGNVVIAKTPRFGMLANMALMEAFADAFPPGVVSLLPGDGRAVLPGIISHKTNDIFGNAMGTIDVFAFIGSEGAANAILKGHPTPSFVHKILGLGAKNAGIVLAGADLDIVAARLVKGSLGFNGQRCTAEKIIFAPAGGEGDKLVAAIAERVGKLPLGMPWDPNVAITPLPEPQKLESMWALISDAVGKGARIANDGGGRGCYSIMRPAVLDHVAVGMKIYDEEQFGPVVPVARYEHLDEVIAWHVRSPYGQQAGIHGPDSAARRDLANALTSYVARVNLDDVCQRGPDTFGFTAADKSGHGTLSIRAALLSFSRSVIVQSPDRDAVERC
jgi:glyceraldehyde-3-phosphate dehydrogenase (NADP+)